MRPKNSKLLSVLFILIVIPVVLLAARSASFMMTQRRAIGDFWGRYVRQLARFGAARFDEWGNDARLSDFLGLLQDRGYERIQERLSGREIPRARDEWEDGPPGKFVMGLLAYVRQDGTPVAGSDQSGILSSLWSGRPQKEAVQGSVELTGAAGGERVTYSLCVWPTRDPDIVTVAAVMLNVWEGTSPMTRFVQETLFVALFCLTVLFLLIRVLIRPLRALSSGLRAFDWGREIPKIGMEEGKFFGLRVEEVASLKSAILELAREAVEKTELEKRYVGDVVKAQEDERNRLAREIHDGPIQIVAALIQRVQMASLSKEGGQEQLLLAEEAAQHAVEDLRGICDSLVPPWVSLGLARCMEETASRLARQYDIAIDVDVDFSINLSQDKTLALFRIFQEGVSNAVRHGRAARMKLSVARDGDKGDKISFTLRDDGAGFDVGTLGMEKLYASGRRGIVGMRQRVESFGGTFSIVSAPGGGATVNAGFSAG